LSVDTWHHLLLLQKLSILTITILAITSTVRIARVARQISPMPDDATFAQRSRSFYAQVRKTRRTAAMMLWLTALSFTWTIMPMAYSIAVGASGKPWTILFSTAGYMFEALSLELTLCALISCASRWMRDKLLDLTAKTASSSPSPKAEPRHLADVDRS
jgi:hypothetical protein